MTLYNHESNVINESHRTRYQTNSTIPNSHVDISDFGSRHSMLVRVFAVNCIAASYTYFQTQCERHQSNDKSVLDYLPQRTTTRQVLQITPHAEPGVSTPSSWRRSPASLCVPLPASIMTHCNSSSCILEPCSSIRFRKRLIASCHTTIKLIPESLPCPNTNHAKGNTGEPKTHYTTRPCPQ